MLEQSPFLVILCSLSVDPKTRLVSNRMLRHLLLLGMGPIQLQDLKSILSVHIQNFSSDWRAGVHAHVPRVTTAIVDIYEEVTTNLRITPLTP